jgi:hypothetical protein
VIVRPLILAQVRAMPDDNLFLEHRHPASRRLAVLEDGGYSRELIADGPGGHPWSDEVFESTFGPIEPD